MHVIKRYLYRLLLIKHTIDKRYTASIINSRITYTSLNSKYLQIRKPRLQAACKRGFLIIQSEAYLSSFLLPNCGKAEPWPNDNKPASA